MESAGNNHKRIFFNWLLCLSFLLSIIALYVSLSFDEKVQSRAEQIIQEQYLETVKLTEDFHAYQQRLQSLAETLLKLQSSILAIEQRMKRLGTTVRDGKASDSVNASLSGSTERSQKPVQQTAPQSTSVYIIKSGDTFSKIAVTHGVSLQKLMDANRQLNPRSLKVGQEIIIPK